MSIDNGIRFIGVSGRNGEILCEMYGKQIKHLLDDDEVKMSMHYAHIRWDTRKKLAHKIGDVKYSFAEYETVKQITIPINNNEILLISTEKNVEYEKIINHVMNVLSADEMQD